MNIDNAKENIKPLAVGRNISLLSVALNAETQEDANRELLQKRAEFEQLIEEYCGNDPLEIWYEYILWIEQCYPKSGKKSAFDDVLGRCITTLENDTKYHQDRRMIKIYIKYIDFLPNPHEHYNTLYNQGIGTMVADLYICWAYYFEIMKNFERAEKIYQLGFDARAQPIDELDQAHQQFVLSVGQLTLYSDEKVRQSFFSTMEERRSALTSLLGHQTQGIGSVRTGGVIKENNPGRIEQKLVPISTAMSSSGIPIYVDEYSNVSQSKSTGELIIRSIVDSGKKQENQWEPGPWSKAKTRSQSNTLFPFTGQTDSKLNFDIMEDSNEWNGNVHVPMNFAAQNIQQAVWNVNVAIHEDYPAGVFPQYDKIVCYPKGLHTCFSPEELRAYKFHKQGRIKVGILEDLSKLMECDFQKGSRLPEHFRHTNDPQEPFQIDKCKVESFPNQKLMCRINAMNLINEKEEMSFEELYAIQYKLKEKCRETLTNTKFSIPTPPFQNTNINETCSTQTFNFFIKPQLVSTPKTSIKKTILTPRSSLPLSQEQVYNSTETAKQSEMKSHETNDAMNGTVQRLSTIWEITEPSASTGSSAVNTKSSTSSEEAVESIPITSNGRKSTKSLIVTKSRFYSAQETKSLPNNSAKLFNEEISSSNPIIIYEDPSENILMLQKKEYIADDSSGFAQSPSSIQYQYKNSCFDQNDELTPSNIKECSERSNMTRIAYTNFGKSQTESITNIVGISHGLYTNVATEDNNGSTVSDQIFQDSVRSSSHLNGQSMTNFLTLDAPEVSLLKQENSMHSKSGKHKNPQIEMQIDCLSVPKLPKFDYLSIDQDDQYENQNFSNVDEKSKLAVNTSLTFPTADMHIRSTSMKTNILEETTRNRVNENHCTSLTVPYMDDIWTCNAKDINRGKNTIEGYSNSIQPLIVSHVSENDPLRMKITMRDTSKQFATGYDSQSPHLKKSTKNMNQESPSLSSNGSDISESIYIHKNNSCNEIVNLEEEWGEDDNQPLSSYQRKEVDMNETQQVINDNLNLEVVNPFNPKLINAFLEKADFMNFLENLETCTLTHNVKMLKPNTVLEMNGFSVDVGKLLGSGTFGKVYQGKCRETGKIYALKQERPTNLWEYYILLELKCRMHDMNKSLMSAFADVEYAMIGNNASILALPFCRYGTLVNVCNLHKSSTEKNLHEYIVIVLATQILSIIDHLHACNIIHADVKPDNFMLTTKLNYDSPYSSLKLIDFGQSIDMKLFPDNITFNYVVKTEGFTCTEMMENKPWTYQTDLFGVAATIHVLLFGKYMNVEKSFRGWVMTTKLPRYFQKTMWERIFSTLLNVRDCQSMPNLQDIKFMLQKELAIKEQAVRDQIIKFNSVLDNYKPGS